MIAHCPKHGVMEAVEKMDGDLHYCCGLIIYARPPLGIPENLKGSQGSKHDKAAGVAGTELRGHLNLAGRRG